MIPVRARKERRGRVSPQGNPIPHAVEMRRTAARRAESQRTRRSERRRMTRARRSARVRPTRAGAGERSGRARPRKRTRSGRARETQGAADAHRHEGNPKAPASKTGACNGRAGRSAIRFPTRPKGGRAKTDASGHFFAPMPHIGAPERPDRIRQSAFAQVARNQSRHVKGNSRHSRKKSALRADFHAKGERTQQDRSRARHRLPGSREPTAERA